MLDPDKSLDQLADDYVHGLLIDEEAVMFEERCDSDDEYRRALEQAQGRKEALESLPPAEASEKLVQKAMERIDSHVQGRRRFRRWYFGAIALATALSILLITGFHAYYYNLRPSPYDVRVLGQEAWLAGTTASLRVAVFNQQTGQLMPGVPVTLTLVNRDTREKVELASFKSGDAAATAGQLALPDWENGQYELQVTAQPDGRTETLTQHVRLSRSWKLMLSSDKPVYQPGQKILLRSLALRKPDLKPVAGEQVTFTIADPKGNIIFKQQAAGSKFGIAAAECPLASEILEGEYHIECRIGDTLSDKTVKVEKYVLPKFQVNIELDKPFYQPGDTVAGTVQADYFFRQPVARSEVQIDVRSTDVQQFPIAAITEKTNDEGQAAFRFTLPDKLIGREQDDGNAHFSLVATVTDKAGQKYSRGVRKIVTAQPIRLEVIPESGTLVTGESNIVYLFASYADGRPAVCDIDVNGGERKLKTNRLGVAQFPLTPQAEIDSVGLTVKATDAEGRVGRKHVKLAAGQVAGDFVVRTDKATYAGGETMELTALGGGVEPVFIDFIKDGQTILTQTVEMQDGRGEHAFDLPPELFGTIKVVAYRFANQSGLAVRKTRLIFVRQPRELTVSATLDKEEYRPGTKAKLTLKLTDDDGQPMPGAISLAAVDEAVFAVLSLQPGMEEAFFLLEQELLKPVYALYNWDPFAQPATPPEEIIQLEQAIFSRAARATAGDDAVPVVFVNPDAPPPGGIGRTAPAGMPMVDFAEPIVMDFPPVPTEGALNALSDVSPFTLAAASYPEKYEQTHRTRDNGLVACIIAWWSLAGALVLMGIVTFAIFKPKAFVITAAIVIPLFCVLTATAFILPQLEATRDAARALGIENEVMMFDAVGAMAPGAAINDFDQSFNVEDAAVEMPPEDALSGAPRPRVRESFPETLLWIPELVTDDQGVATLEIDLADSITSWRVSASAVTGEGQLGGGEFPITVFQPFFVDLNLPVSLTRGDQVSVPMVVYNYLDEPQQVTLEVKQADWFTRVDANGLELEENAPLEMQLEPGPNEMHLHMRVKTVGRHQLEVTALGSGISDAIRREIEVVPNGRRVEQVVSGSLSGPAEMELLLPDDAIPGSAKALVKLYPTTFSQLVEGLDAIFQMPYGCFEQTSSTTYPNVLALDYLRRTKTSAPEVEAKARQYIHLGYQRLVSFEVIGGGVDWFGNPPANRTLTAYGLMEFEDMAAVHDVDPRLIERTRNWLLSKREADGRWKAEPSMLNDGLAGSVLRGDDLDLASTAYLAWAVFGTGEAQSSAQATLDYLLAHEPASIKSPYLLALIANCIAGIDNKHSALKEYLGRLDDMKKVSEDGKQMWWELAENSQTMFYGGGQSGNVETTALAALAMIRGNQHSATVKGALTWLVAQKDGSGTWHSTQATVLALKALIEGTSGPLGDEQARRIELAWDGENIRTVDIPADQAEVMQQINLSEKLFPGVNRLKINEPTDTGTAYQVTFWYHVEDIEPPVAAEGEPLTINVTYDRLALAVDDTVSATAIVVNNLKQPAPMVILDLPIPGGFRIETDGLQKLVDDGKIAKFQVTARKAIIYLRQLPPEAQLELPYRLKATMPVKVTVPPAEAYEYYNPARRSSGGAAKLEATIEA